MKTHSCLTFDMFTDFHTLQTAQQKTTKQHTKTKECNSTSSSIMADQEEEICHCYCISRGTIAESVRKGCCTVDQVGEATTAGTGCGGCKQNIEQIIEDVGKEEICPCFQVTRKAVCEAIEQGASTVEEIGAKTQAGSACGNCVPQLEELLKAKAKK